MMMGIPLVCSFPSNLQTRLINSCVCVKKGMNNGIQYLLRGDIIKLSLYHGYNRCFRPGSSQFGEELCCVNYENQSVKYVMSTHNFTAIWT